jgi:VWFA-related protein
LFRNRTANRHDVRPNTEVFIAERPLHGGRPEEEVVKCLVIVFALLFAAVPVAPAQQPSPDVSESPQGVFRSGASLVSLNVTVTDASKRFVRGLQVEDFAVYEDGVPQRVKFFEAGDVPIDLILLIDGSSSMRDKMGVVHEAALGFLETLRDRDRAAIVSFSDNVSVAQPLTSDRAALEIAVKGTQANGATALHNAIYISLKEFGRSAQHGGDLRRQAIAVLSDGEDTSSLVSFDEVLELAKRSETAVYAIGLRSADVYRQRGFSEAEFVLRQLTQQTGGRVFFPKQVSELTGVYAQIADELSSQYTIGYTSRNPKRDGAWRRVIVRLPDSNLTARTKQGYYAPVPVMN